MPESTFPSPEATCPLARRLAAAIRDRGAELTRRWLDRISDRVSIDPNRIFPTSALLDHVPVLMDGVAAYLEDPAREITAEVPVVAKAMELGGLRHEQGFDVYEILKEYELLGGVLYTFLVTEVEHGGEECTRAELLIVAQRLFRAITIIEQTTITHYLDRAQERVKEREERLRAFNRALSHELKNRIGAILGAAEVMRALGEVSGEQREQFTEMISRNARDMQSTLASLIDLTRLDGDQRQQRHVQLPEVAREVVRRLREKAEAAGVAVRVGALPEVDVNAGAVELALTNYVSNAIKYADPAKDERWVHLEGRQNPGDGHCEIEVRVLDNGRGVPEESRDSLFRRFFRAHEGSAAHVEGTGLGLSIVRETIAALGGRSWAEFPTDGQTIFAFSIPCRREEDQP